jgi:hypothetical protein
MRTKIRLRPGRPVHGCRLDNAVLTASTCRGARHAWVYGRRERLLGRRHRLALPVRPQRVADLGRQHRLPGSPGATKEVYRVGSVGDLTVLSGIGRLVIDRWYVVSGRRRTMRVQE